MTAIGLSLDPAIALVLLIGMLALGWLAAQLRASRLRLLAVSLALWGALTLGLMALPDVARLPPTRRSELAAAGLVLLALGAPPLGLMLHSHFLGSRREAHWGSAAAGAMMLVGGLVLGPQLVSLSGGPPSVVGAVAMWGTVAGAVGLALCALLAVLGSRFREEELIALVGHGLLLLGLGIVPLLYPPPLEATIALLAGPTAAAIGLWVVPVVLRDPIALRPADRSGTTGGRARAVPEALRGKVWLLTEQQLTSVQRLMRQGWDEGTPGLVLTHQPPARLRARWGLEELPVLHLARDSFEQLGLSPDQLFQLHPLLRGCLDEPNPPLIYWNDLCYLFANSPEWEVAQLMELLVAQCGRTGGAIVLEDRLLTDDERELLLEEGVVATLQHPEVEAGSRPEATDPRPAAA